MSARTGPGHREPPHIDRERADTFTQSLDRVAGGRIGAVRNAIRAGAGR